MSAPAQKINIRDRIVDFQRIPVEELQDNEKNWRVHPINQRRYMQGVLEEIGQVGAILAYRSERAGGKLKVIDGHLRKEMGGVWPVLITDLTDDEADKMLATLDVINGYADTDQDKFNELIKGLDLQDAALRQMLDDTAGISSIVPVEIPDETIESIETFQPEEKQSKVIPEMELLPYEHYSSFLLLCRTSHDYNALVHLLKIAKAADRRVTENKFGTCRAIDARRLLDLLEANKHGENVEAEE